LDLAGISFNGAGDLGLACFLFYKRHFSFRFFPVKVPFFYHFSCEMRGGVLAQAFSAIFRFVFSLNLTFFKCSLLKYSYSLATLTSALGVATAALQRGSLAPQPLAQRHG
jgi:hypothetical protein